jgi:hypothetical protein
VALPIRHPRIRIDLAQITPDRGIVNNQFPQGSGDAVQLNKVDANRGGYMDVESRRAFRSGFILKEQDLRRLVDIVKQEFAKLQNVQTRPPVCHIKFRNGVLAETNSIDEVLQQENSGSSQIIRLSYDQVTDESPEPSRIFLEFINADQDDETSSISLRYRVFGHNRDWVFVTSSLLEERFDKIKRFAPNQLATTKGTSRLMLSLLFPIFLSAIVGFSFLFLARNMTNIPRPSEKLAEAVKSGQIKDPIDAIIFIESQKETGLLLFRGQLSLLKPTLIGIGLIILGIVVVWFFTKYYPIYNFCWGEYIEEFRRKERARRFWLVAVALGLLLSFIGSLLASKFH